MAYFLLLDILLFYSFISIKIFRIFEYGIFLLLHFTHLYPFHHSLVPRVHNSSKIYSIAIYDIDYKDSKWLFTLCSS